MRGGGGKGHLEFFQKFIRFCRGILPKVQLPHIVLLRFSFAHWKVTCAWHLKFVLFIPNDCSTHQMEHNQVFIFMFVLSSLSHCPNSLPSLIELVHKMRAIFLPSWIYNSCVIHSFILSFIHLWSCRPNLSSSPHRRCVSVSVVRWREGEASFLQLADKPDKEAKAVATHSIHSQNPISIPETRWGPDGLGIENKKMGLKVALTRKKEV